MQTAVQEIRRILKLQPSLLIGDQYNSYYIMSVEPK